MIDPTRKRPIYEPLVPLASGGMAHVWIGTDAATRGSLVALKRGRGADGNLEPIEAILREAELAAKIRHPNVATVYGVETSVEGEPTLVLEYVEGCTLKQLAERLGKDAPIRVMLRVVLDAAKGLAAVHAASIVHRDVTPSNVLVGVDGVSRLTDFGVSKTAAEAREANERGVLKGKPAYFAPEYIEGAKPDAACDLFALGVVAWEALAGERLFKCESDVETLARILKGPVTPPSRARAALAVLDAPILRALARDRRARYGSVVELITTLEAIGVGSDLVASHDEVAACVRRCFGPELASRRSRIERQLEERRARSTRDDVATISIAPLVSDNVRATDSHSAFHPTFQPGRAHRARMHVLLVAAAIFAVVGLGSAARSLATPSAAATPSTLAAAALPPVDVVPTGDVAVQHIELEPPEAPKMPAPRPPKKVERSGGGRASTWSPKPAIPAATPIPKTMPPNPYASR